MEIDNIIKESLEDSVDNLDLPVEKYEEMFNYITDKGELKKQSFKSRLLQGINALFRGFNYKDAIGIAAFVMVLILIPTAVNYTKNKTNIIENSKVNSAEKNSKAYDFSRQLEGIIFNANLITNFKIEDFKDEKEIKEKVLFPIEYPKFIPEGYKLTSTEMRISEDYLGKICDVGLRYSKSLTESFYIMQITDTGRTDELIKQCEKISINGIEAYLYNPNGGNIQIMFWKNGKFYNVFSDTVGKDNLINIAKSLDFNLQGDTRKSYRRGTLEVFEYNEKTKDRISFSFDFPKYMTNGYKERKPNVMNYNIDGNILNVVLVNYINDRDFINIIETDDKSNLQGVIEKSKKISINDLDAWLYEGNGDKNPIPKIMFWKNGKRYVVSGTKITKEELIKIAESL